MSRREATAQRPRPKAVVHVDLDGADRIFRVHGWPWERASDRLFETGLEGCLRLFAEFDIRATLFVIAEDLQQPEKRRLIAAAQRAGHEIASHSLTHADLTALSLSEKRREIHESRSRIGDHLGEAPAGFRAPQFRIDQECADLLQEAGYSYDSSLFPTTRPGRTFPHRLVPRFPHPMAGDGVMELPLPMKPLGIAPFHPSYSLVLGNAYFQIGLRYVRAGAAPFVLLFHLTDFSAPLAADLLPGVSARFFTLSYLKSETKRRRCKRMLALVERQYEIVSTQELIEWTQSRPGDESKTL